MLTEPLIRTQQSTDTEHTLALFPNVTIFRRYLPSSQATPRYYAIGRTIHVAYKVDHCWIEHIRVAQDRMAVPEEQTTLELSEELPVRADPRLLFSLKPASCRVVHPPRGCTANNSVS